MVRKSFAQVVFLTLGTAVSLAGLSLAANTPTASLSTLNDGAIDSPAAHSPRIDLSRVQRKPAVEPRVYVENSASKTGFVYYDYADQEAPPVAQRPPHSNY